MRAVLLSLQAVWGPGEPKTHLPEIEAPCWGSFCHSACPMQGRVTGFACTQARLLTRAGRGGEESSKPAGPRGWRPGQRGSTAEGGSCQELLLGEGGCVRPGVG